MPRSLGSQRRRPYPCRRVSHQREGGARRRGQANHQRPQHAPQGADPRRPGDPARRGTRGVIHQALHRAAIPAVPRPIRDPRRGRGCVRGNRIPGRVGWAAHLSSPLPPEFKNLLTQQQLSALDYLTRLENNPRDTASYSAWRTSTTTPTGGAGCRQCWQASSNALQGFATTRSTRAEPERSECAGRLRCPALLQRSGRPSHRRGAAGLAADPNNVNGLYNLGIFYWQSNRQDLPQAAAQFRKLLGLLKNDQSQQELYKQWGSIST